MLPATSSPPHPIVFSTLLCLLSSSSSLPPPLLFSNIAVYSSSSVTFDSTHIRIIARFAAVVGEKERNNTTVNVRTRDNKVHGEHTVSHVIERFKHFKEEKTVDAEDKF